MAVPPKNLTSESPSEPEESMGSQRRLPLFAAVSVRCVEERPQNATAIVEERDAVSVASCTIDVSIADATVRVPMGADSATVDAVISALRRSR